MTFTKLFFIGILCWVPLANAGDYGACGSQRYAKSLQWLRIKSSLLIKSSHSEIYGQANIAVPSRLCVLNDDSGSAAGSNVRTELQGAITDGKPAWSIQNVAPCGSQWSLLGDNLAMLVANCNNRTDRFGVPLLGVHYLAITDGCSNHRNPFKARRDQTFFNRAMVELSSGSQSNFIGVNITCTMDNIDAANNQITERHDNINPTSWSNLPQVQSYCDVVNMCVGICNGGGQISTDNIHRLAASVIDHAASIR
jgi:hypothetical protein